MEDWEGFKSQEMANAMGNMIKVDDPADMDQMQMEVNMDGHKRKNVV